MPEGSAESMPKNHVLATQKSTRQHRRTHRIKAQCITLWLALLALPSYAHVKWFVDPNMATPANFEPYSITDTHVLVWIVCALFLIAASVFLDGIIPDLTFGKATLRKDVIEILRIFTGMSLMLTAYEGNLIAPHLPGYGWLGMVLIFLEAFIGIMFITNRFMNHASIFIFLLFLGVLIQHGFVSVLEYINIVGIALFFLFNNMPTESAKAKFQPYAVDVLRIFTGFALIMLGITEKLHGAALGQAFLSQHNWNFMPMLGFDFFTDRLFVLSAGVMEVVFGTILIIGTTTRINTLVVSSFMLASNTVFLIVNNQEAALMELIGHMPIIGSALVLILLGYGEKIKITHWFAKNKPKQA